MKVPCPAPFFDRSQFAAASIYMKILLWLSHITLGWTNLTYIIFKKRKLVTEMDWVAFAECLLMQLALLCVWIKSIIGHNYHSADYPSVYGEWQNVDSDS